MKLITAKEAYEQKFNTSLVFLQDFYHSHGGLDGIAYD